MRLISIKLENFRQHMSTEIHFADGVTAIVGANGSGKTTLLEAVAWSLYGSPAIRESNDTVRSKASSGGARVSVLLTFELGGELYTVTRRMSANSKSTEAAMEQNGSVICVGQRDVTNKVASLLGMDYKSFFSSFFTGQKELDFMGSMDGAARAAQISRMLGYERITKARDKIISERRALDNRIEGMEKTLGNPDEIKERLIHSKARLAKTENKLKTALITLSESDANLSKIRPELELFEQKKAKSVELLSVVEKHRIELKHTVNRLSELEKQNIELEHNKKNLVSLEPKMAEIAQMAEEFKELKKVSGSERRRNEINTSLKLLKQDIKNLRADFSNIEKTEAELFAAQTHLKELEKKLARTDVQIKSVNDARIAEINTIKANISTTKKTGAQLQNKRKEIAQAGEDGKCPTCERPFSGELRVVLAGFDAQITDLASDISIFTQRLSQLEQPLPEFEELLSVNEKIKNQISEHQAIVNNQQVKLHQLKLAETSVNEKTIEVSKLQNELSKLPEFDKIRYDYLFEYGQNTQETRIHYKMLQESVKNEHALIDDLHKTKLLKDKLEVQIQSLQQEINALDYDQQKYEKILETSKIAQSALTEARVECERCKADNISAAELLEQVKKDYTLYKTKFQELAETRKERLYLHTLHVTMDAFRSELNTRIRPDLEYIASEILSDITESRYNILELDEGYKANIRDDGEIKSVISGGEEDVVTLALRLAVSQMIAETAGQDLSLLILDEVFGSLDESRRDNLVALLQNLKKRFGQIILITHIDAIHDAVDNTIWIEFDEKNKCSMIKDSADTVDSLVLV